MSYDSGARKRAQKAKKIATNIINGSTYGTMTISSVVNAMDSTKTTIASNVNYIRVNSYYNDNLELNAGALWRRSPTQSAGPGRRLFADNTYWEICEAVIDPCMLGARSSDNTTDSLAYINEALSFFNNTIGVGGTTSGARKVRLNPPARILSFPTQSGSYCVSGEVILQPGVEFEIAAGARLLALPGFTGSAVISTLDNPTWGDNKTKLIVRGVVDANGVTSGIWIRYGGYILSDIMGGDVVGCTLWGHRTGSPTGTAPAFLCTRIGGTFKAVLASSYAAAQTINDPTSIGVWHSNTSDCACYGPTEIVGFRTGAQEDGTLNYWYGPIHPWTGKIASNQYGGPMSTGFYITGTGNVIYGVYIDTPSSMGNSSITRTYCVNFANTATSNQIRGLRTFLQYDDPGTSTYQNAQAVVINAPSGMDGLCTNSVDDIDLLTANNAITYYALFQGSGQRYISRTNVNVRSGVGIAVGSGDTFLAYERPQIGKSIDAKKRRNLLDNGGLSIWQRGAGAFDCSASNTRVFGPDRWSSISDGTGTRSISRVSVLDSESGGFYRQSQYAMNLSQSGTITGTYWRIEQLLPIEMLYALQQRDMTLQFQIKLASGTRPGTNMIIGLRQNFGTGGSTEVISEQQFSVGTLNSNYKAVTAGYAQWPSITGKTISSDAYCSIYIGLPVTGTYSISITEIMMSFGTERPIFELIEPAEELRRAQRYYETVQAVTINGSQFINCLPKFKTPTCTATNGTVGTITQNGALITDTTSRSSTLTFISPEF
jgi:hypothetical protein